MTPTSKFDLSAESAGLLLDVRLNAIPLTPIRAAAAPWHLSLNQYLVEGVNTVSVTLSSSPGEDSAASARVEINENGSPIFVFVHPPPLDPPEDLPFTVEEEFEFETAIGPRAWEPATPIDEAAGPPPALIAFLQRVEQALRQGDVDAAVSLFSTKTRDLAKVYGLDGEAQLADQRKYFESLFRDPFWGMEPVNPSGVQIRCGAGGRLVFVHALYGRHPLRSVPDAEGITNYFPVAVSLIDGEWVIVL